MKKNCIERFHECYIKDSSGCWLWVGYLRAKRYGSLYYLGKYEAAHRISYQIYIGQIPEGMCVCHRCDTPLCVNPEHLWIGTHSENMQDMWNKKRKDNSGERNGRSKLSFKKAEEIRKKYKKGETNLSKLGRMYNISHTQVSKIINNKVWVIPNEHY